MGTGNSKSSEKKRAQKPSRLEERRQNSSPEIPATITDKGLKHSGFPHIDNVPLEELRERLRKLGVPSEAKSREEIVTVLLAIMGELDAEEETEQPIQRPTVKNEGGPPDDMRESIKASDAPGHLTEKQLEMLEFWMKKTKEGSGLVHVHKAQPIKQEEISDPKQKPTAATDHPLPTFGYGTEETFSESFSECEYRQTDPHVTHLADDELLSAKATVATNISTTATLFEISGFRFTIGERISIGKRSGIVEGPSKDGTQVRIRSSDGILYKADPGSTSRV